MSDLAATRRPEPFIEYHRNHPELDTGSLLRFIKEWHKMGYPLLEAVWRDEHGGWVRWLWFKAADGMHHCLWMPSLGNPTPPLTEDEKKYVKYVGDRQALRRKHPDYVHDAHEEPK